MENMCATAQAWDVNLLYYGRHRKSHVDELGAGFEDNLDSFLGKCDIVTINVPLTDKTRRVAALHHLVTAANCKGLTAQDPGHCLSKSALSFLQLICWSSLLWLKDSG